MKVFFALLACLMVLLPVMYAGPTEAADDDTQASVYLVFDPETGDFVTVHDPAVTAQHEAQQDQEAIESVADVADEATGAATAPTPWIIGAGVGALLLGGAVWLQRKKPQTPQS